MLFTLHFEERRCKLHLKKKGKKEKQFPIPGIYRYFTKLVGNVCHNNSKVHVRNFEKVLINIGWFNLISLQCFGQLNLNPEWILQITLNKQYLSFPLPVLCPSNMYFKYTLHPAIPFIPFLQNSNTNSRTYFLCRSSQSQRDLVSSSLKRLRLFAHWRLWELVFLFGSSFSPPPPPSLALTP